MVKDKEPFELLEHLGTGGFAQTWLARVIEPDLMEEYGKEYVAIKIPLNRQKEKILKQELILTGILHLQLREMESKNIVKYLGFEIFDRKNVMVMEYISGGSLRNIIGNIGRWKRMDPGKSVAIAHGILKGLSVIHEKHIVHRDIKPENILMDGKIPKITDLGIGRMLETNELASSTVGTLYYMSPELLFNKSGASFNTDIWSFGITFYEMLSGQFPFGINAKMPLGIVMDLIKNDNVQLTFPDSVEIPQELQNIVSKALQKDPKYRYQTSDNMLNDIKKFCKKEDDVIEKEMSLIRSLIHDATQASKVEAKLKEILIKFPESSRGYLYLGEFYNKRGNYDKAIRIFKKGISKVPDDSLLHWGMAIAYQEEKNFKSAINALKRALELDLETRLARYAKVLLNTLEKKYKK